jgi:MFS family permease
MADAAPLPDSGSLPDATAPPHRDAATGASARGSTATPPNAPPPTAPPVTAARANYALGVVSVAVFLASSTWFSGTAAAGPLRAAWGLTETQSAWLTISVQIGFVVGTLLYSFFNLADIFRARHVFFASALAGAAFNAAFAFGPERIGPACALRFLTGVTLAGVYPVGMKIVAMWFRSGLGWRLGVMVGALTLGTALPYLLRALGAEFDWRAPVAMSSAAAVGGGALMLLGVGDGPYLSRKARFDGRMLFRVFEHRPFRYQAFGYFGHMWELYAFWALLSSYLGLSFTGDGEAWTARIPLLAFATMGVGAMGWAGGGWVSRAVGERRVALFSLLVSGAMCAASPLLFELPPALLAPLLLVWGFFVVADSPQFSALAARHCPPEYTGTALTIQNGVGFAITVVSIQLLSWLVESNAAGLDWITWRNAFAVLTVGPVFGAIYMQRLGRLERARIE